MKIASMFVTSLILVIILYLVSICLTFLIPNYADAPFSSATPSMFFGWIWFSVFSLVQFVTTWLPILAICVGGGIADIILKLLSNIWNAIPVLSDLFYFYYPGVTFQNSINTILTINERAYVTILSLGTELEWQGAEAAGYWVNQGAGLLGNLGYFSSNIPDIAQQLFDDFVAAGQVVYDGLVAEGQEAAAALIGTAQVSADFIITAGQTSADAIVAEAEALLTLIEDKTVIIQGHIDGEGHWVTQYPFWALGQPITTWHWDVLPDWPAAIICLGELMLELIAELANFQ